MKLRYLFVFALLLVASQPTVNLPIVSDAMEDERIINLPLSIPNDLIGIWRGTAIQINPPDSYSILISLTNGGVGSIVGTVAYPELRCGGELTLQSVNGSSIELREDITYNYNTNCIEEGIITLTLLTANTLNYSYYSPSYPTTATGSMTRISNTGTAVPATYIGIWKGVTSQGGQWTILLGLSNGNIGQIVGAIAYPSLFCGGELTLSSVSAESIKLLQDITYGYCVDNMTIDLRAIDSSTLYYEERYPNGDVAGSGTVTRIGANSCTVPFISQVDENWKNHPLRTLPGPNECSSYCSTIGHCGCTLTSATMAFNTYGANTNPAQVSDCMDTSACQFDWTTSINCSSGKVTSVSRPIFSLNQVDIELNQNHRPVILGMCKTDTCYLDHDNDPKTFAQTHWVLVFSGHGNNPVDYLINDPAFKCSASVPLSIYSDDWTFTDLGIYRSIVPCSSLNALTPPCVSRGANPQPVQFSPQGQLGSKSLYTIASPTSVISGTVWIYTRSEITMTLEVTASSTVGNITDMVIWSDSMPNTHWQPYTPFVWLPVSDWVYVQYRDDMGNVSDTYSDTINPIGPPTAPYFEMYLSSIWKR